MKTKLFYFFAIALLSGLTVFVSSCSENDDEKIPDVEENEQSYIDDVDFVRRKLVSLDANGNFKGLLWGVCIDESRPTTAYVRVENLNEAKEIWQVFIPYDAKAVANGNNQSVELTDANGKKLGDMRFNVLDNGKELAEIVFSSSKLIDVHVSRLVFILSSLWPNNDGEYDGLVPVMMTRKTTGEKYAVVSMPSTAGVSGYIMHIGNKRYITDREHENGGALLMRHFPSTGSVKQIACEFAKNPELWGTLSRISGLSVEELQKSRYFLSHTDGLKQFVYNINGKAETVMFPLLFSKSFEATEATHAGYYCYTSRVYIMTIQNGAIQLTMDNNFEMNKIPNDIANELILTMDDFELEY